MVWLTLRLGAQVFPFWWNFSLTKFQPLCHGQKCFLVLDICLVFQRITRVFILLLKNFNITLGPALGSALYSVGGFLLPFLVVGIWCLLGAFGILFTIPNVKVDDQKDSNDNRKKLTLKDLAKVSIYKYLNFRAKNRIFAVFLCLLLIMIEAHFVQKGV